MIFLVLALLMLMAWAARSQPAGGSGGDIAAKVNGVPITTLELNRSFQAHVQVPYSTVQEDPRAKEVLRQILDNLIDRELLLQQAKSLKMAVPCATGRHPDAATDATVSLPRGVRASPDSAKSHHGSMKKDVEGQLLRQQLVKKEILDKVNVSAGDVQTLLRQE